MVGLTALEDYKIMALGDITVFRQASSGGGAGSFTFIAGPSVVAIQAGEPVMLVAGATAVLPNQATNLLAVPNSPYSMTGTGLLGIASTTGTNTSSAAGSIEIIPPGSGMTWLITANNSTNVNTQAKYDALVGHRVLIDLTSGSYTLLTSDSAANGCIIMPLSVFKFPGKIAFKFFDAVSALY